MEENQKQTEPSIEGTGQKVKLNARFTPLRGALAAGILLLTSLVLFLQSHLLWEETEQGEAVFCVNFIVVLGGLTLCSVLFCFLEITLPKWTREIAGWAVVLLLPLGTFYGVDLINNTRILAFSPLKCFANYLCYLMGFALVYAVFRRVWLTALLGGGVFLLFGIANYFVIQFRGQPILPWDIQAAATALEVSGGYQYRLTRAMVISLAALVFMVICCFQLFPGKKERPARKQRLAERGCALLLSLVLMVLIFPIDVLTDMGISVWAWNQKVSSEITGVMAGFYANIQFLLVEKPEGYSAEAVKELGEELRSLEEPEPLGSPETSPTVIVVMNESFTDLASVGDLQLDTDPLSFVHSLQDSGEVIWGTAYSSVYGGNTCNSEYEFLTGNTTAFLPSGSKPYQQYVDHEQTALPSLLKEQGYSCTAIHPGNRSAWQRDKAYPYLGFDQFISARDFDIKREMERDLTSDRSHYKQIIYEYEHRNPGEKQFLFTVTIQNHGGFEDKSYPTTVHVESVGGEPVSEGKYPQTEQYLSLMKSSDDALREFLNYFEEQEEPVVVLFFGDHWPNLEMGFLSRLLNTNANDPDFEALMKEHQVPFLIWANYPLESQQIEAVSLNYLSGLLLRAAGLEGSSYTKFLENLRADLPVITAVGTVDRDGNWYQNGEGDLAGVLQGDSAQKRNEYAILQYNNAFGEEDKVTSIFTR